MAKDDLVGYIDDPCSTVLNLRWPVCGCEGLTKTTKTTILPVPVGDTHSASQYTQTHTVRRAWRKGAMA